MLRASKSCSNGVIRSKLVIRPNQHRLGIQMFKRCESTLIEEPKKSSGSLFGKLLGLTFIVGASYGGAAYYALHDPAFRRQFTQYVPGGEDTLKFLQDLQNNNDAYLRKATDLKQQAKSYSLKLQESTQDVLDHATSAYQTLTGQKEVPKLPHDSSQQTPPTKKPQTAVSTISQHVTSSNTTLQLSTDKATQPAVVNVAIEKPEPIIVKQVASSNPYVRELFQIVTELATILNETGLSGLGRTIIHEAEEALEHLNSRIQTLDADQAAILKSLQHLRTQGEALEGSLERFHVQAKQNLERVQIETAAQIVAREAQLKNAFEQTRADMKTTFAQQLAKDLEAQQERLERARQDALQEQSETLQRRFVKEVKLLVEQERAGRLAKLDVIDKRFKALEQYAVQNAQQLDTSRQRHIIHVALDACWSALESAHGSQFNDELQALVHNSKEDPVIRTVLSVVPEEAAKEGVATLSELSRRFELVSDEIRRVALVPEDGGFGSHIISWAMSLLMFKKQGLVEGDDVESVLARTDYYLKRDNLDYATRELNQLTGWSKRLAHDWIQSARRHLEVKQALEQGVDERMKDGVTIILLGASGDLAKKKTFPALYALFNTHFMPGKVNIVGYARTKMTREEFHKRIASSLEKDEHDSNDNISKFLDVCHYVSGQYDEDASFKRLNEFVSELEEKAQMSKEQRNRIFYMALPPGVFIAAATGLRKHVSSKEPATTSLVVEKPFGKDLESSNVLSDAIGKLYQPEQVYRIDHYLGKELAKNLMYVRFSNRIFNSIWNASQIDSVQITLKESLSTVGRGGYFDEYGVIRDVMQNHLMQLFCMATMERPISRDAEAIRDEKVKVLRCVKPVKLEDTLLGQYVGNGKEPGYRDDDAVPNDSLTATFAAMVLWIDNERWDNVPFILKAGKGMDNSKAEIRIQFKKLPGSLFDDVPRNELVFRVQPGEAVYMKFNNKVPGFSYETMITELDLTYKNRYDNLNIPEAYENMILDIMRGDHSTFVRDDELKAAWRIFTPLLHQIEEQKIKPEPYEFGTRGPKGLNDFVRKYGVERLPHENYQWPLQPID
ncbi:MAG: glucose-6-phosphate dehydrogenase [Benjaminiella poitrasii]|nr:MAG: glucose-6-phosphate dehydrogenase [Benjaminiella poitrasii]